MAKGIKGFPKGEKHWNYKGNYITIKCPCGNEKKCQPSNIKKYCSWDCYKKYHKGKCWNKGISPSKETIKKMRLAKLGKPSGQKGIKRPNFMGEKHPNWRGGRSKTKSGYILVRSLEHPFCSKLGYIPEHRLTMEKKLGRYLKKNEIVHHLNGVKDDNREENLKIFSSRGEHLKWKHYGG